MGNNRINWKKQTQQTKFLHGKKKKIRAWIYLIKESETYKDILKYTKKGKKSLLQYKIKDIVPVVRNNSSLQWFQRYEEVTEGNATKPNTIKGERIFFFKTR